MIVYFMSLRNSKTVFGLAEVKLQSKQNLQFSPLGDIAVNPTGSSAFARVFEFDIIVYHARH